MALSITAALSRKRSVDFQSEGCSLSITAEVDSGLLNRPAELQHEVQRLYRELDFAIEKQLDRPQQAAQAQPPHEPQPRSNGRTNGNGNGHLPKATASQLRAIKSIAKTLDADANAFALEKLGTDLDDATLPQASKLIDSLKAQQLQRSNV